jgi:hypothetical protein
MTKNGLSHVIRIPLFMVVFYSLSCSQKPCRTEPSVRLSHGDLKISENRHFLNHTDGTPFFYLADTAWELFHRLNREEAEQYLENRRQKRFTVIQAVALAELDGLNTPNAYGDVPFLDLDPDKPAVTQGSDPTDAEQYDYWDHVDFIVRMAARKGLYIGLLPTWGDKFLPLWGKGPAVFNEANARRYGKFIGDRYKDAPNIIWILGGDRPAEQEGSDVRPVIRAMAEGIKSQDPNHLMTYHPWGGASSSRWFHADDWLDFNLLQSGHQEKNLRNDLQVERDYQMQPVKPCMDGESRYEDHPVAWNSSYGWFDAFDIRQAAYWALFAGAHGHTYGNHNIWQMLDSGRDPVSEARHFWCQTLDLEGAFQMTCVRNLIESRPFLERVPDQSLILSQPEAGGPFIRATRGKDYAFIYSPFGYPISVRMGQIAGEVINALWFNPRNGVTTPIGKFSNTGNQQFVPLSGPGRGNDWILILDNAARKYPAPLSCEL